MNVVRHNVIGHSFTCGACTLKPIRCRIERPIRYSVDCMKVLLGVSVLSVNYRTK